MGFISVVINSKDGKSFTANLVSIFEKYHLKEPFDIVESSEVDACGLLIKEKYVEIKLVVKLHAPVALLGYYILKKNSNLKFKIKWGLKALITLGKINTSGFYITPKDSDLEYKITKIANGIYSPSNALNDELIRLWRLDKPVARIPNYYSIDKAKSLAIYD